MTDTTAEVQVSDLRQGLTDRLAREVIARHGGMVLAACRRILNDEAAAQDAAQDVFITFARKAARLPQGTLIGGWLYRTACFVAQKRLRAETRRINRETAAHAMHSIDSDSDETGTWQELEPLLDTALESLPPHRRDLVVHCFFQGKNQHQAAVQLGWTDSKVSREMSAAMESLRRWFQRRGTLTSASGFASLCLTRAAQGAQMAAPGQLATAMVQASAVPVGMVGYYWASLGMKSAVAAFVAAFVAAVVLAGGAWLGTKNASSVEPSMSVAGLDASKNVSLTGKPAPGTTQQTTAAATSREEPFAALWASARPDAAEGDLHQRIRVAAMELDGDRQFDLLRGLGVQLARADFDATRARVSQMDKNLLLTREGCDTWIVNFATPWAHTEPLEAAAWALSRPLNRDQLMNSVVKEAAKIVSSRDAAEWDAFVSSIPDESLRKRVGWEKLRMSDPSAALASWLREPDAPPALLTAIMSQLPKGKLAEMLPALRSRMSESHFEWFVMQHALRLTPEQARQVARDLLASNEEAGHALRALAGDKEASFEKAVNHALRTKSSFTLNLYSAWNQSDPSAALEHVLQNRTGPWQGALESMIRQGARSGTLDEPTLATLMTGSESEALDRALMALFHAQEGGDTARVLRRVAESSHLHDQIRCAKPLLKQWTQIEPSQAAAWLDSLPASPDHAELRQALAEEWAMVEPEAALTYARAHELPLYPALVSQLASGYALKKDLNMALGFARQFEDKHLREAALLAVIQSRHTSASHAMSLLRSEFGEGWQDAALGLLRSSTFIRADPAAAAAELMQLAPAMSQNDAFYRAVIQITGVWIEQQPINALNWSLSLPAREGALARYSALMRWAQASNDQSSVMTWLQTAPLSAKERESLTRVLK